MGFLIGTLYLLRERFCSGNPFLLREELSSGIVAALECTNRVEYGMRTFFQITAPQNQEENFDPHEPKVLFLGTPVKQDSSG